MSGVSVALQRLSKYIRLGLLLQKSINPSVDFCNLVPSLAVFRSLSYFRGSTYTPLVLKLNNSREGGMSEEQIGLEDFY